MLTMLTPNSVLISDDATLIYKPAYNRDRHVVIASDQDDTVSSLDTLFRLEGFKVFTCNSAQAVEAALDQTQVSILVVHFNAATSLSVLAMTRAHQMGVGVFVIFSEHDIDDTVTAMRAGAFDVLKTPFNPERLINGVRDLMRSNTHVLPPVHGHRQVVIRGFSQLTPRERQVLQLTVNGKSNRESALELGISARTVEVHRARLMMKIGAKNTADLIRIALTS